MTLTQNIQKRLNDSPAARWGAMAIVSFTMMCGYFITDIMAPLEDILTKSVADGGLGWTSGEYGFFSGAYGYINVFLLMLFFGGIILDKCGIRFTGIMSCALMFAGTLLKWYAVDTDFGDGSLFGYPTQVALASLGFAIFGMGAEITGITVTKVIAKWFTGHELALAMGAQVALARLGTAAALSLALPFAQQFGGVSASVALGATLLCAGVLAFLVYCVMDRKLDKSAAESTGREPEEVFRMADLKLLFFNRGFWYITLLCLMFYAGVFPFLKFATKLMVIKYGVEADLAGWIPSMLPYGTIVLTPLFGYVYDRIGKGATLMVIGSVLLTLVHAVFAIPTVNSIGVAVCMMIVLGVAFGLVPSAMWPSVPKIIPIHLLGSAYALIFYIQNIGLSLVPIAIGKINQANTDAQGVIDYTQTMATFTSFGIIAIVIALLLLREDKKKGYGLEEKNIK